MKLRLMITTITAALLSGCGGGGDDDGGNASTPASSATPPQGTYIGAATVGDFATFNVSGNTLSYNLTGAVLGSQSGSLTLTSVFGPIWKDISSNIHLFLSNNIGIARVPAGTAFTHVVGLQQTQSIDPATISNKSYIYIYVPNTGIPEGHLLTINNDGTYNAQSAAGNTETGCWKVLNGDHIVAQRNTTTCTNVIDSTATYRIALKPGNSRTGMIVDYVDGSGFGIGVEQKALSSADVASGTYNSYYSDPSFGGDGFAQVTLNNGSFSWSDYDTQTNTLTPFTSGSIALNTLCDGTPINGVACATTAQGKKFDLFVDPTDGYYIAVGSDRGSVDATGYLEIGSNQ